MTFDTGYLLNYHNQLAIGFLLCRHMNQDAKNLFPNLNLQLNRSLGTTAFSGIKKERNEPKSSHNAITSFTVNEQCTPHFISLLLLTLHLLLSFPKDDGLSPSHHDHQRQPRRRRNDNPRPRCHGRNSNHPRRNTKQ